MTELIIFFLFEEYTHFNLGICFIDKITLLENQLERKDEECVQLRSILEREELAGLEKLQELNGVANELLTLHCKQGLDTHQSVFTNWLVNTTKSTNSNRNWMPQAVKSIF